MWRIEFDRVFFFIKGIQMCTFITAQVHNTCWVRGKKKGEKKTLSFLIWTVKCITFFLWLCRTLCQSQMADRMTRPVEDCLHSEINTWSTIWYGLFVPSNQSGLDISLIIDNTIMKLVSWWCMCDFCDRIYDLGPVLRVGQVFEKVKIWTWRKSLWVFAGYVWNSKLGRK